MFTLRKSRKLKMLLLIINPKCVQLLSSTALFTSCWLRISFSTRQDRSCSLAFPAKLCLRGNSWTYSSTTLHLHQQQGKGFWAPTVPQTQLCWECKGTTSVLSCTEGNSKQTGCKQSS